MPSQPSFQALLFAELQELSREYDLLLDQRNQLADQMELICRHLRLLKELAELERESSHDNSE